MDYAVIMSGGTGTRFWPKSRNSMPKQFLKTVGDKTMIQNTVERIGKCISNENIHVVTNRNYVNMINDQLPDIRTENIFVEPYNKETATCIGYAAIKLLHKDKDAVMAVLPSDHIIKNVEEFRKTIKEALYIANSKNVLVTMGVVPSRAETAYGYIETGKEIEYGGDIPLYSAKRFTEKPNRTVAQIFLDKGTFLWNSGMFVWRAAFLIEQYQKYLPEIYSNLMMMAQAIGTPDEYKIIEEEYKKIDGISIDFGIMEKCQNVVVLKTNLEWDDIGSWNAMEKYYTKDNYNNIIEGICKGVDTRDCMIFGDSRLIASIGINNLLVVDTGDIILICDRNRDQEIKDLVRQLKNSKGFEKFL